MTMQEIMARLAEITERRKAIGDEFRALDDGAGDSPLEGDSAERWAELESEDDDLKAQVADLERRKSRLEEIERLAETPENVKPAVPDTPPNINRGGDPYDLSEVHATGRARDREVRARALDAIERDKQFVTEEHRSAAARLVQRSGNQPGLSELVLARMSEDYTEAFWKKAFNETLSDRERNAFDRVMHLRAMALSDVTGVLVPAQLDTTVILSNDGTINPFRRISRVETGTTNVWTGITSAGITASWDAEAAEVSDDAPSFSNPTVTAYKGSAFVPISIEAYEDARGREDTIVRMFADARDRLESTAFATGNGTSAARGIVTALDANTNVEVETTTSNVFGLVDVYNLYEQVPARWRMTSTWACNVAIVNDIRQFGTNNLSTQTVDLTADGIPRILGRPVAESEEMDGTIAAGGEDNFLILGDFSNYLVYDRIGMSVEFIPHLFHTTSNRPSGQRGWYTHWRTGANSLVDTAFRLLQAHTNS